MNGNARYSDLFAGVLVGGRGTRMGGRDKARLRRNDGATFGEHIVRSLTGVVSEVVLAAGAGQSFVELGCRTVVDHYPAAGPLAGLEALLLAPPAPWCFLVACDLPHFDARVLEPLVAARDGRCRVVVPLTPNGLQPTCALYASDLHGAIRDMLDRGQRRLIELFAPAGHVVVPLPEELSATLVNVNRAEDWPTG